MTGRSLFNRYKKFALVTLPRFYKKIPKTLWILAGAFGFFCLGIVFTFFMESESYPVSYEDLEKRNDELLKLIDGYEQLSDLYYYQGQNVSVLTNFDIYETNPAEVAEALSEADRYKDKILVQQGRIMELRKSAGFLDPESSPNTQ